MEVVGYGNTDSLYILEVLRGEGEVGAIVLPGASFGYLITMKSDIQNYRLILQVTDVVAQQLCKIRRCLCFRSTSTRACAETALSRASWAHAARTCSSVLRRQRFHWKRKRKVI